MKILECVVAYWDAVLDNKTEIGKPQEDTAGKKDPVRLTHGRDLQ